MLSNRFWASAAAVALIFAPVSAFARNAASIAPAAEEAEGNELRGRTWAYLLLPAVIVLVLVIAMIQDEKDDGPISP